jgi:hypothetical protein
MDKGMKTVVRTPYALQILKKDGTEGLIDKEVYYEAMQGCGQGDVPSSCIWTAVADILLTALESVTHGAFYYQDAAGRNHPATAIAYADDTIDITGTHAAFQDKADIYCAFAAILGFQVSPSKMKAFGINWGNEHRDSPEFIIIHDRLWLPQSVPIKSDGTCKQLGMQWDLDHTNTVEFDKAYRRLSKTVLKY